LKNKVLNFAKKPFIKNVFILASGTAMAQAVNMLFSPLITRIYGPEAYGLMGTFQSIIMIIAPVAALTYPISMVLPKRDEEAIQIGKLSLVTTFINTLIVSIILFIFGDLIIDLFNLESISSFLILIPIIIMFAGLLQIIEQWVIRKKLFDVSAKSNLLEVIITNSGKLGVGLVYPIAPVLIFFTAIKQGIRAFLMFIIAGRSLVNSLFNNSVEKSTLTLAKEHIDFPMYRAPETFFNATAGSLPLLLLTSFFGPAAAGFYSLAKTVLGVPVTLIGNTVGKVFFPKVSEAANDNEKITPLISRATFYLAIVASIPFSIIILFGPWLFSFVFGQEWAVAGEYARWLAIWSYSTFINRPCVQSLPILSAQRFLLIFTVSALILKIIALLIGFFIFGSDIVAMALFGIVGALANLYLILQTILKSKNYDKFNFE